MNRQTGWITALLALNCAMWLYVSRDKGNAKVTPALLPGSAQVSTNSVVKPKATPPIVIRTNAFQWEQLESEDYRTYIARLRSIGCPEETIRDLVIADLEKLMAPKLAAVDGPHDAPKYWKAERKDLLRPVESLEKQKIKQGIDFEKREVIQELLGVDLAAEKSKISGQPDFYEERLGFLGTEKRMRVRMAIEQASQEEVLLREKSWLENDELTAEEKKKLREIHSKKEQTIAALLTPEELEQYNLWFSPSAYRTREALSTLDPSENDFLAVYRIQREFDSGWGEVETAELNPEEKEKYEAARSEYEAQIREYLGDERFEQFQQARNPDFQQLQQTVAQFSLQPGVTTQVWEYRKALEAERARVAKDPAISAEKKQQVYQALNDEAERAVVEAMGPKAFRYYVRAGAGKWIFQK